MSTFILTAMKCGFYVLQPEPMQVGRLFGRGNVAVYDFHRWGCVTERQKQCILQQKLSIDFPLTCGQFVARLNGIIQQVADDDHQINRSDLYSRKVIDLKTNINVVLFGHLRFLIQQRDSSVRCIFAAPIGWLEVLDLLCRVLRSDGGSRAVSKRALFRLRNHRQRCGAANAL